MKTVNEMSREEILEKLRDDEMYYGEFGRNFLSNSDIYNLLNRPDEFGTPSENSIPFVIGGYFHTLVLEPHKLEKYKIITASTRSTKTYKELSDGEICLLQHEADMIESWRDKVLRNEFLRKLIQDGNVEYEVPGLGELEGQLFKGKADILNHDERLIIDLKTTGDIDNFHRSAYKYNYNSQAAIYKKLFGYDMVFVVVDKKTGRVGFFDCSDKFMASGYNKVANAVMVYHELMDNPERFKQNYLIEATL